MRRARPSEILPLEDARRPAARIASPGGPRVSLPRAAAGMNGAPRHKLLSEGIPVKFLTAALAVCVLALTACAGAGAPASGQAEPSPAEDSPSPAVVPSAAAGSPTSQPSIVVTPELTPATLTVEQAAASYKAIAKTYNKQLKRLQKKYANATSLAANRKFYAKLAEYEKAFLKGLKAIAFRPISSPTPIGLSRQSWSTVARSFRPPRRLRRSRCRLRPRP